MTCTAAIQELLEMARMPGGSDRALVAMLDLSERDPAALSTLLILAMKARVERSGMLRAAAELLPDNSATEVCRFAWSEFKSGNSHWLAAEIAAQAAYRVPGLLHDDWDAVLRLSAHEPVEGPFWRELPIEVGRRWIQEARGASSSVAGLLGLPFEMSGWWSSKTPCVIYPVHGMSLGQQLDGKDCLVLRWARDARCMERVACTCVSLRSSSACNWRNLPAWRAASSVCIRPGRVGMRRQWHIWAVAWKGDVEYAAHHCSVCWSWSWP